MPRIIAHKNLLWLRGLALLIISLVALIYYTGYAAPRSSDPIQAESVRPAQPTTTLDRIKAKGVLTALTRYNASSYFIYRGQLMGYDYELLRLLADHLGVELRIITTRGWDEMFAALESGAGEIIEIGRAHV